MLFPESDGNIDRPRYVRKVKLLEVCWCRDDKYCNYNLGYLKGLGNFLIVAGRTLVEVCLSNDGETDRLTL